MRYEFDITIASSGENKTEAWYEAVCALALDPGTPPEECRELDDDDEEVKG